MIPFDSIAAVEQPTMIDSQSCVLHLRISAKLEKCHSRAISVLTLHVLTAILLVCELDFT
jgi:hypothetical protein